MKKIHFIAIALFSVALQTVSAQETQRTRPSSFNVKIGPSYISGDGKKKVGVTLGFSVEQYLNKHLILGISVDGGSMKTEAYSGYYYTSKTSFAQVTPIIKYNILQPKSKYTLAPFLGIGYTIYNAKASENNSIIRFVNGTASEPKSTGNLLYSTGAELGFSVGKNIVGLELTNNFIQSDRFDATAGLLNGVDGHKFKGKVIDLKKGDVGKTKNDAWIGVRFKISIPINKER